MVYIKILGDCRFIDKKTREYKYLIKNELLTIKEFNKLNSLTNLTDYVEVLQIPKNQTFWCFGARFEK